MAKNDVSNLQAYLTVIVSIIIFLILGFVISTCSPEYHPIPLIGVFGFFGFLFGLIIIISFSIKNTTYEWWD